MPNVGPLEIIIVLVIVFLIFGAKRLPEVGSSLGQSIRGFGKGLKGDEPASLEPASLESAESTEESAESTEERAESGSKVAAPSNESRS